MSDYYLLIDILPLVSGTLTLVFLHLGCLWLAHYLYTALKIFGSQCAENPPITIPPRPPCFPQENWGELSRKAQLYLNLSPVIGATLGPICCHGLILWLVWTRSERGYLSCIASIALLGFGGVVALICDCWLSAPDQGPPSHQGQQDQQDHHQGRLSRRRSD